MIENQQYYCKFCHQFLLDHVIWKSINNEEQFFCSSECCYLWLKEQKKEKSKIK